MNVLKNILKEVFIFLHLDVTKNLKYDRLTRKILKNFLKRDFNCIDIGCHKGEILNTMIQYAPDGKHYAFEPIPYLFKDLENKYKNAATIFPYALSDHHGTTSFQLVKNAPAYSGLQRRHYDIKNPDIEEINVEIKTLDEILFPQQIHFIKIDVEGGEFGVLKGGKDLLKMNKPIILFECGKGASDYYGTTPSDIYQFISHEIGLKIYTLQAFLKNEQALNEIEFEHCFDTCKEYYFIACCR